MGASWTPALSVREAAPGRCRLALAGCAEGEGATLQDAADDLVVRLREVALALRAAGLGVTPEAGAPDPRWLEFIWEVGELASRGGDVRARVFGHV